MDSIQTQQKLQLVHLLRSETEQNKARLKGHENILYGNIPLENSIQDTHTASNTVHAPNKIPHLTSFRIRLLISIILLCTYIFLNYYRISLLGISIDEIQHRVIEDWIVLPDEVLKLFDF